MFTVVVVYIYKCTCCLHVYTYMYMHVHELYLCIYFQLLSCVYTCTFSYSGCVSVSSATKETTPTQFAEADTLHLLSSLISWHEDTARSMRVKVRPHAITSLLHHIYDVIMMSLLHRLPFRNPAFKRLFLSSDRSPPSLVTPSPSSLAVSPTFAHSFARPPCRR